MRQPVMYIDTGGGYVNVTGHAGATAGLAGFTIEWGTDKLDEQPDPNVLHFQLMDHPHRRHARADPTVTHATVAGPQPQHAMG